MNTRGFNNFFDKQLLEEEQAPGQQRGLQDPFSVGGSGSMLPQKNLKFRSSEMQFLGIKKNVRGILAFLCLCVWWCRSYAIGGKW